MRREPGRLPAPFGRFDVAGIALSSAALALWIVMPEEAPTGVGLLAAAALNLVRLCRWAGDRSFSDRLVLVLHVGYAFVPLYSSGVGRLYAEDLIVKIEGAAGTMIVSA
jgi:uncharacterized protein involved in response to NO